MKLQDQVVSLELARKLKKLGVKQESLWYWVILDLARNKWGIVSKKKLEKWEKEITKVEHYSAFTVAELGEMLKVAFRKLPGTMINDPRGYFKRAWQKITGFENEADNRTKVLIYLLENKLI